MRLRCSIVSECFAFIALFYSYDVRLSTHNSVRLKSAATRTKAAYAASYTTVNLPDIISLEYRKLTCTNLPPPHPSLSPLKGERKEDEAFDLGEGWGGVYFSSIYLNPFAVFSLPFPLVFDFDLFTSAIAS